VCVFSCICVLNSSTLNRSTLALIISGYIRSAGGLTFTGFDLTGACLPSNDLSVV